MLNCRILLLLLSTVWYVEESLSNPNLFLVQVDDSAGGYTAWTKELLRHQSLNVVFTVIFVWGGEAIL
jgi:hypothetical protein